VVESGKSTASNKQINITQRTNQPLTNSNVQLVRSSSKCTHGVVHAK